MASISTLPEADAETAAEVEGDDGVEPEEADLDDRRVEGEAVEVVEDPGERRLAAVAAACGSGTAHERGCQKKLRK